MKAQDFLKMLKDNRSKLTHQQIATLRGQALSGDIDGAYKGFYKTLDKAIALLKAQEPIDGDTISRSALLAAYDAAHKGHPGGARKLIEEAPAVVLKAQEARVLTRDEIINANGYIWEEYSGMWAMTAVLIEYGMERIPYKGDYSTLELDWRSYGVTWRCWNVCPTEEQREAAAWEN